MKSGSQVTLDKGQRMALSLVYVYLHVLGKRAIYTNFYTTYLILIHMALDKGQRMALSFGTCISPCTKLACYIYQLLYHILNSNTPGLEQSSKNGFDLWYMYISMYSV